MNCAAGSARKRLALTLSDPATGQPLEIEFNRSMLSASLRFLSYSSTEASLLPDLIHRAASGAARAARRPGRHGVAADPRSARERHAKQRDLQRGRALLRRRRHRQGKARANLPRAGSTRCARGSLQTMAAGAGGRGFAQRVAQRRADPAAVGRGGPGHAARETPNAWRRGSRAIGIWCCAARGTASWRPAACRN